MLSNDGAAQAYGSDDMSNLDDYDSLLMDLNINNNHWVLVYINRISQTFYYIDSFTRSTRSEMTKGNEILPMFKNFIKDKRNNQTWINTNFQVQFIRHSRQTDGYNCGVYAMKVS